MIKISHEDTKHTKYKKNYFIRLYSVLNSFFVVLAALCEAKKDFRMNRHEPAAHKG
jgi:hypothetical protein